MHNLILDGMMECFPLFSILVHTPTWCNCSIMLKVVLFLCVCVKAVLCSQSIPPPVLSFGRVMVVQFTTDSSVSARGFSANLSVISEKGECINTHKHTELVLVLQPTTQLTHPHTYHVYITNTLVKQSIYSGRLIRS